MIKYFGPQLGRDILMLDFHQIYNIEHNSMTLNIAYPIRHLAGDLGWMGCLSPGWRCTVYTRI